MTDQQRGAYTPQQDVPLQFDPRSPASRRPMPMALIASGTLLVVLIAAVAMYYSRGVRGDNEPPRPVGEPVATLKTAPAAGAQPADDSLDVSAPQNVPGKVPVFAAAPEEPKARPAPAAPTKLTVQTLSAADMNKPEPAPAVATPAPVKAAAVKTPPAKTTTIAAAAVAPAPESPAAPVVKPAPVKSVATATAATSASAAPTSAKPKAAAAAPPVKTIAAAGPATGARVQIGAFSSAALADKGYSDVAALLSGSMAGKAKHVEPVDKDGATLYRTSVTGFSDRAAATAFCEALKAKGKICIVKS
jgi:hypothetical protein